MNPPAVTAAPLVLRGVDFTSRPTPRKPIVVAEGQLFGDVLRLERMRGFADESGFADSLREPGPWLGGFDFPFGLPRELVNTLGWPDTWADLISHYRRLDRTEIRSTFAAFCNARPAGSKFAHRACDGSAGASSSMKWVNPPVAYMLHTGVPALLDAGCDLPGLQAGDPRRMALEAYPGLLAREILGRRTYKSDDRAHQTPERLLARRDLVDALEQGRTRLGLRLKLTVAQHDALVADPSGDRLDAVLCLLQAGWASRQPRHGWPETVDGIEGWILTA
ncbi:MAG: DUF429 domain-containing protein [Sphaerotilus sp.]|nr:DUF429 domain-containing protein [Sphaerotilus sp.]